MTIKRTYMIELGSSLGLYFLLIFAAKAADRIWRLQGGARLAVAALPMIGCIAALIAIMRQIRSLDEFQRRIQLEALAFSFAATAMITLTWGFLEGAGAPQFPTFGVWPLMGFTWAIGGFIAQRRYR